MPIYNTVTMSKKINELSEEMEVLNKKLDEVIKNQLNEREGFVEVVSSINLLKIEQFKITEELTSIKDRFCQKPKIEEISTELSTLLDVNDMDKYTDNLKFVGVSKIEDLLLLDINDLCENGILYFDSKKILIAAKAAIENRDLMS